MKPMKLKTQNGVNPLSSRKAEKVAFWPTRGPLRPEFVEAQNRLNSLFSKQVEVLAANPGWTGKGPMEGKPRPCGCRSHFPDLVECPYCGKKWIMGRVK